MTPFRPMLASQCDDINALQYPGHVTDKEDGVRAVIIDGVAMSRSLKPIPNAYIQSILGRSEFNGLDGELTVGATFNSSTSGIMSADGEPDFTFSVFDKFDAPGGYLDRVEALNQIAAPYPRFTFLFPVRVNNRAELDAYVEGALARGKEGAMFRSADGPYKQGRATFREGYLIKCKPLVDAEAIVVGFEERQHNGNIAATNALGRTERSAHKANLAPMGTLGALVCKNDALWPGRTFAIGTGFDDEQRVALWHIRDFPGCGGLVGSMVKFRYQEIGTVDRPRCPVFLGFRHPDDSSDRS